MNSFSQRWREKYEAERASYATILGWDLWKDWELNVRPDWSAAQELSTGLRAHLRGLMGRAQAHELALPDFRDAAADYAQWCKGYGAGNWGEIGQSNTLDAVRLSLLADDSASAAGMLKTRRQFKFNAEEHALLVGLAKGERGSQGQARLEALLERLRNPDLRDKTLRELELVRLELALLLDRLFLAPEAPLDWARAASWVSK